MEELDYRRLLTESVDAWNRWRSLNPEIIPDLSGISLANTKLVDVDLHSAILVKADLKEADLSNANLEDADLSGAVLDLAILDKANLQRAKLDEATLSKAQVAGTVLREASLRHTALEEAVGLSEEQLSGTDLDGAGLPEDIQREPIQKFSEALTRVEHASSNLQTLFFALLGVCIYCWLTMLATSDAQLIANSAASPLPIIGAKISIINFYRSVPFFLLIFYVYFHLHLQRLWDMFAVLPAVFPDGTRLDERSHPRHMSGFVRARCFLLRQSSSAADSLFGWLFVVLSWANVPITLVGLWWTFLPRQDTAGRFGAIVIIVCTTMAVAFGTLSYQRAVATLRTKRDDEVSAFLRAITALLGTPRNGEDANGERTKWDAMSQGLSNMASYVITGITIALLVCLFGLICWYWTYQNDPDRIWGWPAIAFFGCGCLALLLGLPYYRKAVVASQRRGSSGGKGRSLFELLPGRSTLTDTGIALVAIFLVAAGFGLLYQLRPEAISRGEAWFLPLFVIATMLCGLSTSRRIFQTVWTVVRSGVKEDMTHEERARPYTVNLRLVPTVAFGLVFLSLIKVTHTPDCLSGRGKSHISWSIQGRNPLDYIFCYPVAILDYEDISTKAPNWPGTPVSDMQNPQKLSDDLVTGASLRRGTLNHARAYQAFFVKADLYKAKLKEAILDGTNFHRARLQGAQLSKAYLPYADLSEADLRQADLEGVVLPWSSLEKAWLSVFTNCLEGCLDPVKFQEANLVSANLTQAGLEGADLTKARLKGVDLSKAKLSGACLFEADLSEANLHQAKLNETTVPSNCIDQINSCPIGTKNKPSEAVEQKKDNEQTVHDKEPLIYPKDRCRDQRFNFKCKNSSTCLTHLEGADLREANLTQANLTQANLTQANLEGASLKEADLNLADLNLANLNKANLLKTKNLTQNQLNQACVYKTTQIPEGVELPRRPEKCAELWEKERS